jgi:hypothetical protein
MMMDAALITFVVMLISKPRPIITKNAFLIIHIQFQMCRVLVII